MCVFSASDWLLKNKGKTTKEDLKRYEEQQALVKEIVAKFEEKTYSDSKKEDREYIVERMQKVYLLFTKSPLYIIGKAATDL